ncbi:MAG: NFACT family protein [Christensenellales bacterium]
MPNDYVTIKALTQELESALSNGKIDKIYMPEKDEISLSIRAKGHNHLLAISCNPSNPRIHLTSAKKDNPMVAPSFCMHLRKYLTGGIINSIVNLGEDRIVAIEVRSHNEMHDETTFMLIAEMMGRYSNILLVNAKGTITDTLKQVPYDAVTKRCLLPSAKYSLPPQSKILPSDVSSITQALGRYQDGGLAGYLCTCVAGLSKLSAEQILRMAQVSNDVKSLSDEQISSICKALDTLLNVYSTPLYNPCVRGTLQSATYFFVMPYSLGDVPVESLNKAIELTQGQKDQVDRHADKIKFLFKAHRAFVSKTKKKLEVCNSRLRECDNMDRYKKMGELITCNIYNINKGDESAVVTDYYEPECPLLTIPLDGRLSPQANAQAYYKKYAKLKRTQDIVSRQIRELEDLLQYADTILPSITLAQSDDEIAEVAKELQELGALKQPTNKKVKEKPSAPLTFEVDDFVILVGKNNLQNDKLTFKVAGGSDMWVHTKKVHGSHTIIFAEGRSIPNHVITIACEIAAYYSQASQSPSVECDYTLRKNIKRHPSGKPAMVIYTDFSSALVTPNAHHEYQIK